MYCAVYLPVKRDLLQLKVSEKELLEAKKEHPEAPVLSHPECEKNILDRSDFIGSTADIINFAKDSDAEEFIICTEYGVEFKLNEDSPKKKFIFPRTKPCCPDMKLITLDKIAHVLETEENEIEVSEETREKALLPLDRMLELAK